MCLNRPCQHQANSWCPFLTLNSLNVIVSSWIDISIYLFKKLKLVSYIRCPPYLFDRCFVSKQFQLSVTQKSRSWYSSITLHCAPTEQLPKWNCLAFHKSYWVQQSINLYNAFIQRPSLLYISYLSLKGYDRHSRKVCKNS